MHWQHRCNPYSARKSLCVVAPGALGFKSKSTMRTYNLTCNHRRQILHTTVGHPDRWNNKTLIRFDSFTMINLWDAVVNETMDFELRTQQARNDKCRPWGRENFKSERGVCHCRLWIPHINCLVGPSFLPDPLRTVSHSKTVQF